MCHFFVSMCPPGLNWTESGSTRRSRWRTGLSPKATYCNFAGLCLGVSKVEGWRPLGLEDVLKKRILRAPQSTLYLLVLGATYCRWRKRRSMKLHQHWALFEATFGALSSPGSPWFTMVHHGSPWFTMCPDQVMNAILDGRIKATERDQFDPTDFTQGPSMYTVTEQLGAGWCDPSGGVSSTGLAEGMRIWFKPELVIVKKAHFWNDVQADQSL